MFNAPRRTGGTSLSASAFYNAPASSALPADPLAQSTPNPGAFGGEVDPWSSVPSPARSSTPHTVSEEIFNGSTDVPPAMSGASNIGLQGLINDPPSLYTSLLDQLEPSASGQIPLSAVHRLSTTSRLPASTIEKILSLTSRDGSSLSRSEFFCTLGLIALAQSSPSSEPISIERLSASLPGLPLPSLSLQVSTPSGYAVNAGPESPSLSPWGTTRSAPRAPEADRPSDDLSGQLAGLDIEAEKGYWKRLEVVEVDLIPEKEGWFLQKYTVDSSRRGAGPLSRRYTDFVWLNDCLVKRYPFRLLPSLPPKRIGPDAHFLEQRRKGLKRFINMIANHPVTRDDGAVNVFLTETNFEAWRKRVKVSTDEESASKKLSHAQEMGIPADLDQKLSVLRARLPDLHASYQKLVTLAERNLGRLQAASADASRMALSLHTVGEGMPGCCYRSTGGEEGCPSCRGVARGLGEVADAWTTVAEQGERRATVLLQTSIEALKTQRDLYAAFRELFARHDRLSKDTVDSLRKKVETRTKKVESLRSAQKPGWEVEVEKLVAASDVDNSTVNTLLSRRVFIRACMWHELAVVFHSRQAAQATLGWREFAAAEAKAGASTTSVWEGLSERLQSMPGEA